MKNFLEKGIIPVGAYCPPMSPVKGRRENLITEKQYKAMKDAGVDVIYAHSEVMNTDTEEYAFLSLELAEKTGLVVLVRDEIANEYVSLGNKGYKAFDELSDQEKQDLDQRFIDSIKRYRDYKAFGGISFYDEPGYDSFDGIARAKKVFDSVCPDKTFYVNMYPYYITPNQFQFGYWNNALKGRPTDPHFDIVEGGRNIDRYEFLYDEYIRIVKPDYFSYDAYPIWSLGDFNTTVHEILWEMPQFLHGKEMENGIPFFVYLQVGGKWEGSYHVRVPNFAEVSLNVAVPLLYGAKGLQLFPYCYPNDWLSDDIAYAGMIDRNGNKTELYTYYQTVLGYVRAMQEYLIKSKLKGIIKTGEYKNGLPSKEEFSKIPWNECFFQGNLSPKYNIEITKYNGVKNVQSDIQCLTGCLDINGKNGFIVVNNSTINDANYKISFEKTGRYLTIKNGVKTEVCVDQILFEIHKGEFALIVEME